MALARCCSNTARPATRPDEADDEVERGDTPSVVILGAGPNRIGQGIEFDYCCVHASFALREAGFETIMVNCNPETVSTDYDTSDRLYFEPLTLEDVLEVFHAERAVGPVAGVIVQLGLAGAEMSLPFNTVVAKEFDLRGAFRFHEEFALGVELLRKGLIDVKPLISATLPFTSAKQAFDLASDRQRAMKVQLAFG